MRKIGLIVSVLFLTCSLGCARYKSQAPVQDINTLPTRYQTNTNHTNSLYNNNANYMNNRTQPRGVKVSNEVARTIKQSYPNVEAVSVVIIKEKAYVAVTLHANRSLGNMRYEIPALVKHMEPTVERVYLSTNPNFKRMVEQYQK